MASHPIDFTIQANVYSFPELASVFDEKKRLSRWLEVEATLAEIQGDMGIIPREAADAIRAAATLERIDCAELAQAYQESRNSLLPLVKGLKAACDPPWGEFVHYGVTTQDIIDTAFILELRDGLRILYRDLRQLEEVLIHLAALHKETVMVGRTHGQQALPITFGFKAAIWLCETRRHIKRLQHLAPRLFVGQMSGAVGTMAALGDRATNMGRMVMDRLDLGWKPLPWHASRDNIAEAASVIAILATTCEKIADEIYHLGKTEIGELREASGKGQMASSAMPHKSNPVLSQRISVLGRQIRALSSVVMDAMIHEHERDPRALWSEWLAMPQIIIYCGTAIAYLKKIMTTLDVDTKKMHQNLTLHPELITSEWLVYRLAGVMGKMKAQEKVHELIQSAQTESRPLKDLLREDPITDGILTDDDYLLLGRPEKYTGQAIPLTIAILKDIEVERSVDPLTL